MRIDPTTLPPGSRLALRIASAIARDDALNGGRVSSGMPIAATETRAGLEISRRTTRASGKRQKPARGQISSPGTHSPESWSREEDLHRAVWSMIQVEARADVVIFHPANGGGRSKAEAGRMKAQGVVPGVPDLLCIIGDGNGNATVCGLELKTDRGRMSPAQRQMAERFKTAGAEYEIARSVLSARQHLRRWGALK